MNFFITCFLWVLGIFVAWLGLGLVIVWWFHCAGNTDLRDENEARWNDDK